MSTLLSRENLAGKMQQTLGRNSSELMGAASSCKTYEELFIAQNPIFEQMACEFTEAVLRELERLGVDLAPVWTILERERLTSWSN